MKLRNNTKYVHVWYEGYDGLSAIVNRVKVLDDACLSTFLAHPSLTTKNIKRIAEPPPGSCYKVEVTSGKALPRITREACEILYNLIHYAIVDKQRNRDIVVYRLPVDAFNHGEIHNILYDQESNLKVEIPVCTTARYLFEEAENGRIIIGHRIYCAPKNTVDYATGTSPLDTDQF